MYVRLAFAVAAHLEPEILVVDEVLAVGDAEFQKKCLGKMSEVATGGRTVLFVSHNMAAIESFCQRALLLNHGHLVAQGSKHEILRAYHIHQNELVRDLVPLVNHPGRISSLRPIMKALRIRGTDIGLAAMGGSLDFEVAFDPIHDRLDPRWVLLRGPQLGFQCSGSTTG